jgi:hypothetical protein
MTGSARSINENIAYSCERIRQSVRSDSSDDELWSLLREISRENKWLVEYYSDELIRHLAESRFAEDAAYRADILDRLREDIRASREQGKLSMLYELVIQHSSAEQVAVTLFAGLERELLDLYRDDLLNKVISDNEKMLLEEVRELLLNDGSDSIIRQTFIERHQATLLNDLRNKHKAQVIQCLKEELIRGLIDDPQFVKEVEERARREIIQRLFR